MKKTDIKEGVTYQNRSGKAARRVIAIVCDRSTLPGPSYWYETQSGPWVRYMQERGPDKGNEDVSLLSTFASWAHSEDTGAPESVAELREKLEEMRKALEPFAAYYRTLAKMKGMTPKSGPLFCLQTGSPDEAEITVEDLKRAAALVEPCPVRGDDA